MSDPTAAPPFETIRLNGPADLVEAIPYLVGFHPRESLVIVGLEGSQVLVTLRIDLADAELGSTVADAISILDNGGASAMVVAVYHDVVPIGDRLPRRRLAQAVADAGAGRGLITLEALLVTSHKWWSYEGHSSGCACCVGGRTRPGDASVTAATATYAGMVALPDRASLEAMLEPRPRIEREQLRAELERQEHAEVQAALGGQAKRYQRSVKRAIFAAARESDDVLLPRVTVCGSDEQICRFAVGLGDIEVRDALWLAIDQRRLDGRTLWRDLLARLPAPYDAAPLFLYGWATWREGNGALAGIAAERALQSDPDCTAAELLLGAIRHGLDPFRTPRLSRSA